MKITGVKSMDTLPNLDPNLAILLFNDSPFAALVCDQNRTVIGCNKNALLLLSGTVQSVLNKNQSELEKSAFKAIDGEDKLFFMSSGREGVAGKWLRRKDVDLQSATASLYIDVSAEKNAQQECGELRQKLEQLSTVDPVSGLLNRRAMLQSLEPLVSRSRRYNNPLSVISMELLNFDAINQEYGTGGTNEAIKQLSFMLKDQMRWADIVSRTEDNRFVFVLPETDKESATHLADKINSHVAGLSLNYEEQLLRLQVCFGIAAWEKGNDSVLLLRHATQSLDMAKNAGPGSIQGC